MASILVTAFIFQRDPAALADSFDQYIASFRQIEKLGIPTVAFLDEQLGLFDVAPWVLAVRTRLEALDTFALVGRGRILPEERDARKDTEDYMTIMNAKTEFVKKALERTGAGRATWVDFGVCKVFATPEATLRHLRNVDRCGTGVTIGGCWGRPTDFLTPVSWRFAGGFFTGDRASLFSFRAAHEAVLREVAPFLSWEVNLWAKCEKISAFPFNWYRADHNDTLLDFPFAGHPCPVENLGAELRALRGKSDWKTAATLFAGLVRDRGVDNESAAFNRLDPEERYRVLDEAYIANYYLGETQECRRIHAMFARVRVDAHILENGNFLFARLREKGYRLVGTCDPEREPKEGEIIVSFGSYPYSRDCLPWRDKIYRHALWWDSVPLDAFEADPCWDAIGQIYVINLEKRRDRLIEVLAELARMWAPLDRVRRFAAIEPDPQVDSRVSPAVACSRSHLAVLREFLTRPELRHCLVLEDDVTFSSRTTKHRHDLAEFFRRQYDFDVCLINARCDSEIEAFDDLLNRSFQICTTCSGYILSRAGGEKLLPIWERGAERLAQTLDADKYACDRCWAELQKDGKFFVFAERFGYQRIGRSDLGRRETAECDYFC